MRLWQQSMIFLARNKTVKNFMQNRRAMSDLSRRFVGGTDEHTAAANSVDLKAKKFNASLYCLGEYENDLSVINLTMTRLKKISGLLADMGMDVHISVDPTQIGLQVDEEICKENTIQLAGEIKHLTSKAQDHTRNFLMLDMEDSSVTETTLSFFMNLKKKLLPAAVTLQAYLFRSEKDLDEVIKAGGAVRLVKGAFAEGKDIAFTRRSDIDKNYLKLAEQMLSKKARENGFYPVFATHDHRLAHEIIKKAMKNGWKKNEYEFEMLYGVREDFQENLVNSGEQLRLYLPFGKDWWPYAVRRVGENPKNGLFLLRTLFL